MPGRKNRNRFCQAAPDCLAILVRNSSRGTDHVRTRRISPRQNPVRFYRLVPYSIPGDTIGLASYLVVLEGMWLRTKNEVWRSLYHFWLKIFAVNFGMGVVSGLVMAYQFGTNWSGFSQFAGSITGPLLTMKS